MSGKLFDFKTLFKRFVVEIKRSDDGLWWTGLKDGSRQYHLVNVSLIERTFEEGTYKGVQIILLWLSIAIAGSKTYRSKS